MPKNKYIEITFDDGSKLIFANREEVDAVIEGYSPAEYSEKEIEMTQEEFEAIPDFEC